MDVQVCGGWFRLVPRLLAVFGCAEKKSRALVENNAMSDRGWLMVREHLRACSKRGIMTHCHPW